MRTKPQMDRRAMEITPERLVEELKQRIEWKRAVLKEWEQRDGPDRLSISSYMENLALPPLFGFDMNDFYADARLALEIGLRHRIFWLDNSPDDSLPNLSLPATVGMYYDMTLFGMGVRHARNGVPEFLPHPIAGRPDISLLPPFDFRATGAMPGLLRLYEEMCDLAKQECGGEVTISFPNFNRGPLDIAVQLRGYTTFVEDTAERPQFVHALMAHAVRERQRFRECRRRYLREPATPNPSTYVADDWVNVPFITPTMFREFVLPAYRQIQQNEGPITSFHTCGRYEPIIAEFLGEFPGIRRLDVSGWNDFELLDRLLPADIEFSLSLINTFVLAGTRELQLDKLRRIAKLRRRRKVYLNVQAIVQIHDDFSEDMRRVNDFIALAREVCRG